MNCHTDSWNGMPDTHPDKVENNTITAEINKMVKDNKMTKDDIKKYIVETFGAEWMKGNSKSTKKQLISIIVSGRIFQNCEKKYDEAIKNIKLPTAEEIKNMKPTLDAAQLETKCGCKIIINSRDHDECRCDIFGENWICADCYNGEYDDEDDEEEQEFIDAFKADDFEKCKEMFLAKKNKRKEIIVVDLEPDRVTIIKIDGKEYLKSRDTGNVYDLDVYYKEDQLVTVGKWNEEKQQIEFNKIDELEKKYDEAIKNIKLPTAEKIKNMKPTLDAAQLEKLFGN